MSFVVIHILFTYLSRFPFQALPVAIRARSLGRRGRGGAAGRARHRRLHSLLGEDAVLPDLEGARAAPPAAATGDVQQPERAGEAPHRAQHVHRESGTDQDEHEPWLSTSC